MHFVKARKYLNNTYGCYVIAQRSFSQGIKSASLIFILILRMTFLPQGWA